MRIGPLFALVLLPAGLLAAGCTNEVPRVGGSAAPIVAASPTTPATPTSAPSSTVPPASPSPSPSSTSRPAKPSGPVLGHFGFGALKLGMTDRQATATGLIAPWQGSGTTGCAKTTHLLGGTGKDIAQGNVYYSGELGVEIIDAYPGVRTPEGIRIGSSSAAMLKAYPDWRNATEEDKHADGRGYADVPGNPKATYRIMTIKGKVTEITLQDRQQDCYE